MVSLATIRKEFEILPAGELIKKAREAGFKATTAMTRQEIIIGAADVVFRIVSEIPNRKPRRKTVAGEPEVTVSQDVFNAEMQETYNKFGLGEYNPSLALESTTAEETRRMAPGQRVGRGTVRYASEAQMAFIRRLIAERDTSSVSGVNARTLDTYREGNPIALPAAKGLIDALLCCPTDHAKVAVKPSRTATEPMIRFVRSLMAQKDIPADRYSETEKLLSEGISFDDAKTFIEDFKDAPRMSSRKPSNETQSGERLTVADSDAGAIIEANSGRIDEYVIGGYIGSEGTCYLIRRSKSGYLYAKVFDNETGRFEYQSGAFGALKRDAGAKRGTVEAFSALGIRFGVCFECGKMLTVESSIEVGIGPVCARKLG